MQATHATRLGLLAALAAAAVLVASPAVFADFEEDLKRVDEALRDNPSHVLPQALDTCLTRRNFAAQLYADGFHTRASRALRSCFSLLVIPTEAASAPKLTAPTPEALQAKARSELEAALLLTPDVANGLQIFRECAACHMPEGWGLHNGSVPQIAGQHRKVVVKQLADIRAGNRDNVLMAPYSAVEVIGGAQSVADVAAYIGSLEMNTATGKGPGDDLELGERIYQEKCARCHGPAGEGNDETFIPRIQSQHYNYLVRQFEWIRDGRRRNSHAEMVQEIQGFAERETHAVLDYVSRLEPPAALTAPPGWKNPDFEN